MTATVQQRLALRDRFRAVLAAAMEQRNQREDLVDTPDGPEIGWVLFERAAMHEAVNAARAEVGKPAVPVELVERAEGLAVGHVDYHPKFALYCADVFGGRP
jgi:hypothetical protein